MAEEILLLLITNSWSIIHYASTSSVAQRVRPLSSLLVRGAVLAVEHVQFLGNIGEIVVISTKGAHLKMLM